MFRKIRIALTIAISALAISGCGKSENEKAKEKADDGNAKIQRMSAISKELKVYSVDINMKAPTSGPDLSISQINLVEKRLNEYVSLGQGVLRIGKEKNVLLTSEIGIRMGIENAKTHLELLKGQRAQWRTSKSTLDRTTRSSRSAVALSDKDYQEFRKRFGSESDSKVILAIESLKTRYPQLISSNSAENRAGKQDLRLVSDSDLIESTKQVELVLAFGRDCFNFLDHGGMNLSLEETRVLESSCKNVSQFGSRLNTFLNAEAIRRNLSKTALLDDNSELLKAVSLQIGSKPGPAIQVKPTPAYLDVKPAPAATVQEI